MCYTHEMLRMYAVYIEHTENIRHIRLKRESGNVDACCICARWRDACVGVYAYCVFRVRLATCQESNYFVSYKLENSRDAFTVLSARRVTWIIYIHYNASVLVRAYNIPGDIHGIVCVPCAGRHSQMCVVCIRTVNPTFNVGWMNEWMKIWLQHFCLYIFRI